MLRTGLTGGIGAGKSTVARRLVERGAVLVDSDLLAREVVAAGSEGLAAIVTAFGDRVLRADGELDRPALASIVFADADARRELDGIVHPLVRARSDELVAAAAPDAIVVQDVPLLVEGGMAAAFPLVVVVGVDAEERIRRLVSARGMAEQDARARVAAQASDERRRAAADVWLDNSGTEEDTRRRVDALWDGRLVGFEENLRLGRPVPDGPPRLEMVLRQKAGKLMVNLLNRGSGETLSPNRTVIEELPPVHDVTLRIRRASRPQSVTAVPADTEIEWHYGDGIATVTVPRVDIHTVVVVE